MSLNNFFSESSRQLQDASDSRRIADRIASLRCVSKFDEWSTPIIQNAEFFFLATASKDGKPECSVKGGSKGFVKIIDSNCLIFPDYDGNGMFRSLGNIQENPNVGLLFLETSGDGRKLRINGVASITNSPQILRSLPGAKMAVRVTALYIFPNCPRYLPKLSITEESKYSPKPGYTPPDPLWKSKPDLKDYLPAKKS